MIEMETKTALITGITGQDGRLLADLLTRKGYDVTGIARKVVGRTYESLRLPAGTMIIEGDVRDTHFIRNVIEHGSYDEIYHMASMSDVAYSFMHPHETYDININGTLNVLNAIRETSKRSKMYFAGTSEMFGQPPTKPQDENYPMHPRSPYAVSKLAGYWTAKNYREAYQMHVACGILFNHESEIRGRNFVTRKITSGIAEYIRSHEPFELGNLEARKDWGYAGDYVEGMWKMMQFDDTLDDFVLGTGEQHTVREFLETALGYSGIKWANRGRSIYYDTEYNRLIASVTETLYRPSEADNYMADYTKAKNALGWKPEVKFRDLVRIMMEHDLNTV